MKEFLGLGGYTREPEGYMSWQHLAFVTSLMVIMIALSTILGLRNKNKDEKIKNRVLVVSAIAIDALEIFKIVICCIRGEDPLGWLYILPLFLCSIQLITIPLAAFSHGRIQEAALDFVFIFGILGALLGTYEMGGRYSNDITYKNITQIDFFEPDGSVSYKGLFGSNYCKNFYFENCYMTSMDAHCGLYNGTIKNSTFEHMNFIGEGKIILENVTVYADATGGAIKLRDDYGSTWNGEVIVDGLDIRYSRDKYTAMDLFLAKYTDWWFGFETYLPHTVKLNNVKITKYTQTTDALGNRTEIDVATNAIPLNFVSSQVAAYTGDISRLVKNGGAARFNPYHGTKLLEVTNCDNLKIAIPNTPQFAGLSYYRDNELMPR